MPPTLAAARITASGRSAAKKSRTAACDARSSSAWGRVRSLSPPRFSSARTIAEPTMPRWPATKSLRAFTGEAPRRSLVVVVCGESMLLHELVALGGFEVLAHHLGDELLEAYLRRPAELRARLARIAEERLDFGRPEVARIDRHDAAARRVVALLAHAPAAPLERQPDLARRRVHEVAHAVLLAGGDDEVLGLLLLQDQPHHLDEVARMAPVALRVEVAEEEALLQPQLDARQRARDLARDEGLAAHRALVVEEDPVAGVHAVGLAVVHRDPVRVELRDRIGATGIERCGLGLRRLAREAVELGGGRLIEARLLLEAEDAHRFQHAQRPERIGVGGVFRLFEAHRDVGLRGAVVDLIGKHLLDDVR